MVVIFAIVSYILFTHLALQNYILIGDFLRDGYGVNIYYLDWSGWVAMMIVVFSGSVTALVVAVLSKLFSIIHSRK